MTYELVSPPPLDMPGAAWLMDAMEILRDVHHEVIAEQAAEREKTAPKQITDG